MPMTAVVEPTNICQLTCPLCVTGMRVKGRPKGTMKIETAERIVDQLGPYLVEVELDNWGEGFLNPKIFDIIRLFSSARVETALSSNLSLKDFDPEALINSGLSQLIVSTDGATPASYVKYRRGGDFNLVIGNVKKLVETKKKMRKPNPFIMMKFLVFPHNLHEQEDFKKLAASLGADQVLFGEAYYPEALVKNYFPNLTPEQTALIRSNSRPKRTCHWPWAGVTINWDGTISVCCMGNSYHSQHDLGNLNTSDFREIWFGPVYRQIRRVFHGIEPTAPLARPCWNCWTGKMDQTDKV